MSTQPYDHSYQSPITSLSTVAPDLSFVIPVMNEEATLETLIKGIASNVPAGLTHEVILIDDGSSDNSWQVIEALCDITQGVARGIRFRANRGKAAALNVGFEAARGEVIFTMDADLQDDPKEIPRFLRKLDEGYDLVSGWKQVRHDPWHKVLPSRVFNRMLSRFSKVHLHDHNCGFKCYRRVVAKSIDLFGELHRMVPALSGQQGFRVAEIPVTHHAREFGVSKYGVERFIRGFSDMLTMGFLRVFRERPSHFANSCAVVYGAVGMALMVAGLFMGVATIHALACVLVGLCMFAMAGASMIAGLFCELLIRQSRPLLAQQSVVKRMEFSLLAPNVGAKGTASAV